MPHPGFSEVNGKWSNQDFFKTKSGPAHWYMHRAAPGSEIIRGFRAQRLLARSTDPTIHRFCSIQVR